MPVKVARIRSGLYKVSTPNAVHAKGTTLKKAKAQQRLLNAVENNPEFAAMIRAGKGKSKVARPRE